MMISELIAFLSVVAALYAPCSASHGNVTENPFKQSDFDCLQKADGYYRNPLEACSSIFFACFGGITRVMQCAAGLTKYDSTVNSCQFVRYISECGGTPENRTLSSVAATTTTESPYRFECSQMDLGNYADPSSSCSQIFFTCTGGFLGLVRHCPGSTFYAADLDQCLYRHQVAGCKSGSHSVVLSNPTASNSSLALFSNGSSTLSQDKSATSTSVVTETLLDTDKSSGSNRSESQAESTTVKLSSSTLATLLNKPQVTLALIVVQNQSATPLDTVSLVTSAIQEKPTSDSSDNKDRKQDDNDLSTMSTNITMLASSSIVEEQSTGSFLQKLFDVNDSQTSSLATNLAVQSSTLSAEQPVDASVSDLPGNKLENNTDISGLTGDKVALALRVTEPILIMQVSVDAEKLSTISGVGNTSGDENTSGLVSSTSTTSTFVPPDESNTSAANVPVDFTVLPVSVEKDLFLTNSTVNAQPSTNLEFGGQSDKSPDTVFTKNTDLPTSLAALDATTAISTRLSSMTADLPTSSTKEPSAITGSDDGRSMHRIVLEDLTSSIRQEPADTTGSQKINSTEEVSTAQLEDIESELIKNGIQFTASKLSDNSSDSAAVSTSKLEEETIQHNATLTVSKELAETNTEPAIKLVTESSQVRCLGNQDEVIAPPDDPCPDYFYQCYGGQIYLVNCPGFTRYSADLDACLRPEKIPSCLELVN